MLGRQSGACGKRTKRAAVSLVIARHQLSRWALARFEQEQRRDRRHFIAARRTLVERRLELRQAGSKHGDLLRAIRTLRPGDLTFGDCLRQLPQSEAA